MAWHGGAVCGAPVPQPRARANLSAGFPVCPCFLRSSHGGGGGAAPWHWQCEVFSTKPSRRGRKAIQWEAPPMGTCNHLLQDTYLTLWCFILRPMTAGWWCRCAHIGGESPALQMGPQPEPMTCGGVVGEVAFGAQCGTIGGLWPAYIRNVSRTGVVVRCSSLGAGVAMYMPGG